MIFYAVNFFKAPKKSLFCTFYRCERHLKIFGRDAQEMKIAKYFGEKLIFSQQSRMVVFPRAVVASVVLQNLKSRRTTGIFVSNRITFVSCWFLFTLFIKWVKVCA